MNTNRSFHQWLNLLVGAGVLAFALAGCSGKDGSSGTAGAPGPGVATLDSATTLNISITGASINSAPVVNFKVTNQDGVAVAGLTLTDLRFAVAKLIPGSNGAPNKWQSYINTASSGLTGGYVRGNRENNGTLVDNKNGTYTYTFKINIADSAQTCLAAPCIDADGNVIDTSYNASLTHRVAVQTRGALPLANGVYTFIPGSGAVTSAREIVTTAKCNECHNKLEAHDARIDTQYCVMCHNPGSTGGGQVGDVVGPTTVDFKVMIHKIHNGPELPSVLDPDGNPATTTEGDYGIFGFSGNLASFKDVVFPQDIRNCAKCHDGAASAQGDNWKNQPNKAACGSCHDDVYFGALPDPLKPYQIVSHESRSGTTTPDESTCALCHGVGGFVDVTVMHADPLKARAAKVKFNIIDVTGGNTPVIRIQVTDPTNSDAPYDIATGDATTNPIFKTASSSRLALIIGWFSGSKDIQNTGSGLDPWGVESPLQNTDPGKPLGINPVDACDGTPIADWSCTVDGSFIYTLTKLSALPAGATGTGRVGFEGHPAGQDSADAWQALKVKSVYKDFVITGTLTARRDVVDIVKCNKCHDQLSLHGSNRTDEPQLCVICHNPNLTDVTSPSTFSATDPRFPGQRGRPKDAVTFLPLVSPLDGKTQESADFKSMIHAIHAAAKTNYPIGATPGTPAHGFREKGIQVRANDFSHIRFPGILNDCLTCHKPGTYELTGTWGDPTANSILSSSIIATPTATDLTSYRAGLTNQADDFRISPTASVCSSCHDSALTAEHMRLNGAVFAATQLDITNRTALGGYETCAICHGPGKIADVKVVHDVP